MSTPDTDALRFLQETVNVQTKLIGVLFGLLLKTRTLTGDQIGRELEHVTATSPRREAELLAYFQSKFVTSN